MCIYWGLKNPCFSFSCSLQDRTLSSIAEIHWLCDKKVQIFCLRIRPRNRIAIYLIQYFQLIHSSIIFGLLGAMGLSLSCFCAHIHSLKSLCTHTSQILVESNWTNAYFCLFCPILQWIFLSWKLIGRIWDGTHPLP